MHAEICFSILVNLNIYLQGMSTTVVSFILVQVYYHNLHTFFYRICASEHNVLLTKKKKKKSQIALWHVLSVKINSKSSYMCLILNWIENPIFLLNFLFFHKHAFPIVFNWKREVTLIYFLEMVPTKSLIWFLCFYYYFFLNDFYISLVTLKDI